MLRELADCVGELKPRKLLIAEDDRNDSSVVTNMGVDGIWADDFHHQLFVTLTGERDGYYAAYEPGVAALAKTINQGWLYQGEVFGPTNKPRGTPADVLDAPAFVYCLENHDQVGNRARGDRLSQLVSPDANRAAATLLLFLPMTPLLFMGQEWAASTPFLFFTNHDLELGKLVSEGRRAEFKSFKAFADPEAQASIPDPQDPVAFEQSRLNWQEREQGEHGRVLELYRSLLALRKSDPVLRASSRRGLTAQAIGDVLVVKREIEGATRLLVHNLGKNSVALGPLLTQVAPRDTHTPTLIFHSAGEARLQENLPPATAMILGTALRS